jgi:hypothetical protein
LRFRRTGGFGGNLPPLTLDAADLSRSEVTDLERLLAHADLSAVREAPPVRRDSPDAFQYDLDVEIAGRPHRLSVTDRTVPPSLRPLLTQLTRLAQERRASGR